VVEAVAGEPPLLSSFAVLDGRPAPGVGEVASFFPFHGKHLCHSPSPVDHAGPGRDPGTAQSG
jgi:hypothetical protein